MDRIKMEHFEVEKEKFDHFLNGDGEIWFDNNDGVFMTKEEVMQAFKDNNCNTEKDQKSYLKEFSIDGSYNELDMELDYVTDGDYDLDYLIIGETVIMNIARRF